MPTITAYRLPMLSADGHERPLEAVFGGRVSVVVVEEPPQPRVEAVSGTKTVGDGNIRATPVPVQRAPVGEIEALICSYPWPCGEALAVARAESGLNPDAVNRSSGACGLFQLLPCACIEAACNVARAFAKWVDGGGSFWRHWYQWWN